MKKYTHSIAFAVLVLFAFAPAVPAFAYYPYNYGGTNAGFVTYGSQNAPSYMYQTAQNSFTPSAYSYNNSQNYSNYNSSLIPSNNFSQYNTKPFNYSYPSPTRVTPSYNYPVVNSSASQPSYNYSGRSLNSYSYPYRSSVDPSYNYAR